MIPTGVNKKTTVTVTVTVVFLFTQVGITNTHFVNVEYTCHVIDRVIDRHRSLGSFLQPAHATLCDMEGLTPVMQTPAARDDTDTIIARAIAAVQRVRCCALPAAGSLALLGWLAAPGGLRDFAMCSQVLAAAASYVDSPTVTAKGREMIASATAGVQAAIDEVRRAARSSRMTR